MADTPVGTVATQVVVPPHVPSHLVVDFDYVNDPLFKQNPREAYMRLRSGPDIVYTPHQGGHWIATRREIMSEVFQDHDAFTTFPYVIPRSVSSPTPVPFTEVPAPDSLKYRRLLSPLMTAKQVSRFEDYARELMREILDEVQPKGSCDFSVEVAQKLPIFIIMRWLGLPFEDRFMLMNNVDNVLSHPDPAERKKAREFTVRYVTDVVAERQRNPGEDLISQLVNGIVDGRKVTLEEGVSMARNLVHGGLDTVRNAMSFFAWYLAQNPQQRKLLVEDPSLIPAAVEELMRVYAIPNMPRSVVRDMEFHGVSLKQGDQILLPLVLAGLDDKAYDDPLTVNFKRPNLRHISFGLGAHSCAGANLARVELRVFLDEWMRRIPDFRLVPGTQPTTAGGIILAVRSLQLEWNR